MELQQEFLQNYTKLYHQCRLEVVYSNLKLDTTLCSTLKTGNKYSEEKRYHLDLCTLHFCAFNPFPAHMLSIQYAGIGSNSTVRQ